MQTLSLSFVYLRWFYIVQQTSVHNGIPFKEEEKTQPILDFAFDKACDTWQIMIQVMNLHHMIMIHREAVSYDH